MELPEIVRVARQFSVLVKIHGPDSKGLRMRGHAFHLYESGVTTLSASGLLLPDSIPVSPSIIQRLRSLHLSGLIITTASIVEPFLSSRNGDRESQAPHELIATTRIDVIMEGVEAGDGSDGQNIRTLPAQLLEVVDIPSASSALQSLVEAHGGSVPSYSWEVGWSLAPLNPSSQPTMDAFQRQESIHSNVSAMSETRLAFLGVPIVDCKVLPHINISESSERGDLLLVMGSPFGMLSPTHFLNSIAVGTVANCFPAGSDNSSLLMADIRCLPGMEGGPAFDKNARLMGILMKPLHQRGGGAEIQLVITWDAIATACGSGLENKHQRARGENDMEKLHERQAIPFSNSCKHKRATGDFCEDPGSHYLPQSPSEKAATSVALITIGDGSWASGIVLNNNGLILTNAHLLEPWRFGKSHVLGATNDPKASSPDSQLYRSLFHQHERTKLEEKQSVPSQSSWVSDTSFSNEQAFTFSYSSRRGKRIRVRLDHMEPRIWCNATVVYVSQGPLDIALLQLQPVPDKLCAIIPEFVCPSTGSEVHVIGHGLFGPRYGLGPSVSSGVVSKVVKSPIPVISKEKVMPAMLETTAAIYPGASGGALVNVDGHMIGLITSNAKHGGGTIIPHMNFSIPCAALEPVFKFAKDMQDLSMLHALDEPNELLSSIWALMPSPSSKPKSLMEKFKEGKGSRFAKFLAENQAEIALVGKDQPLKAKPTLHNMPRNPGTGRKKIEIRPILNEEARQVTFSKRRMGLFKKAGELCILCGVEMAAIVYSPGGKAFSFGHPSVEAVSDRFLGLANPNNMEAQQNRTTHWRELNKNCEAAEKRVEAGRATSASLDAELKSKVFYNDYYTGGSLDGCSLEEIQRKYNVMCQIKSELLRAAQLAFAPPPGPPANYPGGGGGGPENSGIPPSSGGGVIVPYFGFGGDGGQY